MHIHLDINQTIRFDDPASGKDPHQIVSGALAKRTVDVWEMGGEKMPYLDFAYRHGSWTDQSLKKERLADIREWSSRDPRCKGVHEAALKKIHDFAGDTVPAFFNLLKHLEGKDFKLHLRTFGSDLDATIKESGLEFEKIKADDYDAKELHALFQEHNCAVQDSWKKWNEGGETSASGKLFPYKNDEKAFFFDDNIVRDYQGKHGCVNAVCLDGSTPDFDSLCYDRLIPVDPLEVLEDEHYFTNQLANAGWEA